MGLGSDVVRSARLVCMIDDDDDDDDDDEVSSVTHIAMA
jgi:hypothetical protein